MEHFSSRKGNWWSQTSEVKSILKTHEPFFVSILLTVYFGLSCRLSVEPQETKEGVICPACVPLTCVKQTVQQLKVP